MSQAFFTSELSTKGPLWLFLNYKSLRGFVFSQQHNVSLCFLLCFTVPQIHHWKKRRDTQTSGVRHKDIHQHPKTRSGGTDWWGLRPNLALIQRVRELTLKQKIFSELSSIFRQLSQVPTKLRSRLQSLGLRSLSTVSGESSLSRTFCHSLWMIPKFKRDSSNLKTRCWSSVHGYFISYLYFYSCSSVFHSWANTKTHSLFRAYLFACIFLYNKRFWFWGTIEGNLHMGSGNEGQWSPCIV